MEIDYFIDELDENIKHLSAWLLPMNMKFDSHEITNQLLEYNQVVISDLKTTI